LKGSVDRLTILDGVIIAVGWCEDDSPEVVIDGQPVAKQTCLRYDRADVDQHLGGGFGKKRGFRIAALAPGLIDNSKLAVQLSKGSVLNATPAIPEDRIEEIFHRFMKEVLAAPGNASLIELGSRARSGNSYRSLFTSISHYTGVDIVDGENVDVVTDLHVLSKTIKTQYDFAFSVSVFEHLLMPWVVAVELNKVLSVGGVAYIQSHPTWPLHDEPWDFFRFSKDAWHGIFNALTGFEILDSAYGLEANIVPVLAKRSLASLLSTYRTGDCVSPKSHGDELQGLDRQRTFLLSACLVKKVAKPRVDWSCDPTEVYDLGYKH